MSVHSFRAHEVIMTEQNKAKIEDKHQAILDTTLRLVSERGFHDTPMSLIAKEAGVAAGTIYRYFENKDALINELFITLKKEMLNVAYANIEPTDSPKTMFKKLWRNYFEHCLENPEEMRFIEQFHNSPFQTKEMAATLDKLHEPTMSQFNEMIANGILRDMPYQFFEIFGYDLIISFAKRHLNGKLVMDDAIFEMAFEMVWELLKGPNAE